MGEQVPEQHIPQYPFTAEEIAKANAGDHNGLSDDYVDAHGGYSVSEEDSEEGFQAGIILSDQAERHATQVEQGVEAMYQDAYAENEDRTVVSEK